MLISYSTTFHRKDAKRYCIRRDQEKKHWRNVVNFHAIEMALRDAFRPLAIPMEQYLLNDPSLDHSNPVDQENFPQWRKSLQRKSYRISLAKDEHFGVADFVWLKESSNGGQRYGSLAIEGEVSFLHLPEALSGVKEKGFKVATRIGHLFLNEVGVASVGNGLKRFVALMGSERRRKSGMNTFI